MFVLIIINLLFVILTFKVKADVINPEYLTKKCQPGEKEVVCTFKRKKTFGPITENGCTQYEENSNYYLLSSTGSSFGGSSKYCLKVKEEQEISQNKSGTLPDGFNSTTYILGAIVFVALLSLYYIRKKNV